MPFLESRLFAPSEPMDPKIPPSISQLFRTNSVPSPMDTQRIHHLLQERKAELTAFVGEIDRARAKVARLEHQRDHIEGVVHELEALMSPVRRMPTDIMARVFEQCIWNQDTPRADPRTAPLLLAQVCRSWRYLVFSLPCLWTSLQLDLPSSTHDWEALVRSKSLSMHVWFSRSKALPISLFLNHPKGSIVPWHALMHLDKEILTLGCRLKYLILHFSPRSLSSLLTFTQTPLPHLEHLELQNTNALPSSENPPPIVLHSASRLTSLSVSWCSLDLRHFHVPWAQLQHLNLEYDASSFWNPVHSDYLQILARCPNLTTLSLGIGAPISGVDPVAPVVPVTLGRVHTFRASIYLQTPYLERFFGALRLPRLRAFDVKNVSLALGSFSGQTECLPLLARCADTLESVCFHRVDIADRAVLGCLAQLDRLRTLSFLPGILRLNHGLVSALARDMPGDARVGGGGSDEHGREQAQAQEHGQGRCVCPALETIQLRCSAVVPVDAIARLVASRRPRLKRFSLQLATFEYGLDTRDDKIREVRKRLDAYVEAGMELVLTKTSNSG